MPTTGSYICKNKLSPQQNDCVAELIKKAENQNCHMVKADVSIPLIQAITSEYVLVIPTHKQTIKVLKNCENNEIVFIDSPSLIKIPSQCGVLIENNQFWNKEEVLKGSPFSLPPIKAVPWKQPETQATPIQLSTLDLSKIKHLQDQANLLQELQSQEVHPVTWSIATSLVILMVTITVLMVLWKFYKRRYTKVIEVQKKTENNP